MNLLASPPRAHEERWYQTEAEQSIWNYFDGGGKGNPAIALPTGAGKTHVIVNFIKNVMQRFRGQRFHVTTHVKELIEQNANKFAEAWPYAPYGIHSASLNARDFHNLLFLVAFNRWLSASNYSRRLPFLILSLSMKLI